MNQKTLNPKDCKKMKLSLGVITQQATKKIERY